jgi:hypothetical protein
MPQPPRDAAGLPPDSLALAAALKGEKIETLLQATQVGGSRVDALPAKGEGVSEDVKGSAAVVTHGSDRRAAAAAGDAHPRGGERRRGKR